MEKHARRANWKFVAVIASAIFANGCANSGVSAPQSAGARTQIHQMKSSSGVSYTLVEYEVPTPNSVPHIIAIDKADYVWFSESGGRFAKNFIDVPAKNKIGRLDVNGKITEWRLKGDETSPMGIIFDSKGNLWISERLANRITRKSPDGQEKHFRIPTENAWPTGIAVDSHDNVWFTETKGDKLGVVYAESGSLVEYELPAKKTMTTGIAIDHDDNVWVAERDINVIGKFSQGEKAFTQYLLPTPNARPCNVVVDKAGQVWFSERNGGKLGKITASGAVFEYPLEDGRSGPFIMAADSRGDIWFSELFANRIGRFSPATQNYEHYDIPGKDTHPAGVALDSKGNIWFAEQSVNKIGVIIRTELAYIGGGAATSKGKEHDKEPRKHKFSQYTIPTSQSIPGIVGLTKDGTVWFTEMGGGFVGPSFPPGPPGSAVGYVKDGIVKEMRTLTPEAGPTSMGFDPQNSDVWVTLRAANKIARIRDFKMTEYDIPVPNSLPVGITVDYDHNVWVALSDASVIARMSPGGKWRTLPLEDKDAAPRTVFVSKDNELWFAEKVGNHIGWVDQKKWVAHRYPIPTPQSWPLSLESDDEGNLWFAEMRADRLGVINTKTKVITEHRIPSNSAPFKLVYDKGNDAFWVSTVFGNSVMRFDISKKAVVENYPLPNPNVWVGGIDWDKDKCFWVTEQFGNKLDRLCIEGVSSPQALTLSMQDNQ